MDKSYEKNENSNMSREEFLSNLSSYERIAFQFGNLNYQVENGGFTQWYMNEYNVDSNDLYSFLEDSNFIYKDAFIDILEHISFINESIEKLDVQDYFYEEDYQTRLGNLYLCDNDYNKIKDDWISYFQDYLIENIPNEYVQIINNLEEDIKI